MADDLNTQLVFGANTAGAEAGVRTVKRSLKDLADSAAVAAKSIEGASDQAGKSLAGMGDGAEAAARKIQRDTSAMRGSLQRYLSTLEGGSKDSRKYWEAMADFKGVDKNALRPLLDQLDSYNAKTRVAAETTTEWTGSLTKIGAGVAGVAAVAATVGVAAKAMFDASVNAERLRTMLDFSTGGNSAKEIEYLRGVTFRLGLEFNSTAKAYGQFQAAAKGTALEGDKARAVFESVAKASAVMGLSAADTNGVLLALQQMISKGTVQAEELRGQLGERLPGAFQIAAKAMGVTTSELGKMLEQGQVIADDFLPKFGAALEKNLGGAAEKAAERLDAAVNRFDAAWEKLKQKAGDSGVSKAISQELSAISRDLDAVSDGMDRAGKAGGGMWAQLGAGGVIAAGRVGFSTLNLAANTLNGTINALTGGVFGLRTDLALLPDIFKTDAQYAKALADRLTEAEAKMAALQGTGADTTPNPYIRDSYFQLQEYIKELKVAQAEQAKLTGGAAPNMNEGVVASGRAREQYMNQRAKDLEAANAFRLDQAGVPASYLKDMAELIRLNQAGVLVGKEYNDALKKQQEILLQKTGVTKGVAAAANQEQNAYENLVASIRTKIAANEAEIQGGGRLTESDRLRIKLQEELDAGSKKLTASHKARALALLDVLSAQEKEDARIKGMVAAYKEEAETADELARAYVEQSKAREAGRAAVDGYANGIDEANRALQLEFSLMGQGERARNVALEQYRIELDLKKQIAAIDANTGFDEAQRIEERAKARAAAAIATANASSRAFLEEWKTSVGKYDDIFRQGFADMLNNGKDGWKSFTKSLATTFKTTVADQLYKAFAQPFVVNIVGNLLGLTGSLGLGGASGAAAASASALGGIGNLASLGSNLFSSGLGSTISGAIGSGVGALFGTTAGNAALGTSLGLGAGSATAAAAAAAQAGGASAAAAASAASTGASIAGAIPYIGAAVAALSLLAGKFSGETRTGGQFGVSFDGTVTNQRRGQTYTYQGQQFDRDFSNGQRNALIAGQAYRLEGDPVQNEQAIRDAVSGTASGINAFLKALGSKATLTGFSAGLETSSKGRGGVFAGGILSDGTTFGESGKGDNYAGTLYEKFSTNSPDFKTALENFTLDLKQSTIQALQSVTDIPQTVQKMIKGVDAEALSEEAANALLESINAQIVGVNQFKDALKGMGLDTLAALSFDAAAGLAEVSGGFDKLLGNLGTYYSNFFSPEEQRANMQRQLREQLASLNLTLPDINATDARAQYRRLVEAAEKDLSEEGRKTYATLLQLAGAFAGITTAAEDAGVALQKQQADARDKALRGLERAIAKEKEALQSQIDVASEVADTMSGLFDLLKSNVQELYGEVDSTRSMLAAQGNDFITQALATARTTGYLPDQTQLADAISAARGGMDSSGYSSQFEMDRDRLVLAGQLSELEGLTGKQLTSAERTVKELEAQSEQLDKTLDYWKQQIDIANGTYEATLSVTEAIKSLEKLMFPAKGEIGNLKPEKIGGGGGVSGGASFGPGYGSADNTPAKIDPTTGKRTFSDGSSDYLTENELDLYRRGILGGVYASTAIPKFDVGTNYVPRDMLAQIHEGEAIVPKAYNPAANPGMGGGSSQTEALLAALLEQAARLETRLAAIEGHTQGTNRATNGNPISPVPMALVENATV